MGLFGRVVIILFYKTGTGPFCQIWPPNRDSLPPVFRDIWQP